MSVADAAKELGLTPWTVRQWCNLGKIPATKVPKGWDIPWEAVKVLKHGTPNRPMANLRKRGVLA